MAKFRHHPGHPLADEKGWVVFDENYWSNLPDHDSCGKPYNINHGSINVISDQMADTQHMADGKMYSSKSEFRKATRRAGCVEVGNDKSFMEMKPRKPAQLDKGQRIEAIKQSIYEIKNGKQR